MGKIDEAERLINEGKSCKECRELGIGESTYYRAKGRTTTNEKKPEKPTGENVDVGTKTKETGSDVVPVANSPSGDSGSVAFNNKEVEAIKSKAKPKAASRKKKTVTESKGNTKGMKVESNSNLKVKETKSSWKKKILIAAGLLSLAGIMSLFLKAKAPTEEVETISPLNQNRRIPKTSVHRLKR